MKMRRREVTARLTKETRRFVEKKTKIGEKWLNLCRKHVEKHFSLSWTVCP
jgi:hypothetical protein